MKSIKTLTIFSILWSLNLGIEAVIAGDEPSVNTYSIVAFDPQTGDLGVAVQSKFFGVGSVVPWAEAGVGAIATQSYANTTFGPKGLELLKKGHSASETLALISDQDKALAFRQVGIVDAQGKAVAFTGQKCNGYAGHIIENTYSIQGNLLASKKVLTSMKESYLIIKHPNGDPVSFADRLVNALEGAQSQGGDKRGKQSAALLVVRKNGGYAGLNDRFIDIRVEDHPEPIKELKRLLELHKRFYSKAHKNPPLRGKDMVNQPK